MSLIPTRLLESAKRRPSFSRALALMGMFVFVLAVAIVAIARHGQPFALAQDDGTVDNPREPLAAPTGLTAAPGNRPGEVILKWIPSPQATAHWVWAVADGNPSGPWQSQQVDSTTISGLKNGQQYSFVVMAARQEWSDLSNWAQVDTAAQATTFTSISAGKYHTCGVKSDNSLVCWGRNESGQTESPEGSFQSVSSGEYHVCALRLDNSVVCWGHNQFGQSTPPEGHFKSVSASPEHHACGLKTDGTLACWGRNDANRATPLEGSFKSVTAGWDFTCAIRTDNTVACQGFGMAGKTSPPAGDFQSIDAWDHTCGVRVNGTLACWGQNFDGKATPPDGNFQSVSAGAGHSCGVRENGTVECWGLNHLGQSTPPDGIFQMVTAGRDHTCGLKTDGTAICWGRNDGGQATPPLTTTTSDDPITALPTSAVVLNLSAESPTQMLVSWSLGEDGPAKLSLYRDGALLVRPSLEAGSYRDTNLIPNTLYEYRLVVGLRNGSDISTQSAAATLAHPPEGAGSRSIDWSGFEFYIVDERNPEHTEYRVELSHGGVANVISDWSDSKCRVFDDLSPNARYRYSVVARNLDRIETAPADRRAGEGVEHPETVSGRSYESNDDPWVRDRVNDVVTVYGLTEAAQEWLSNGIRIEWMRGLPGWAGYSDGGYLGIGHSGLGALMHESMHAFWQAWDGWPEPCDKMNFYTFKRDHAQFMLDFREYDRLEQPHPWESWRPYYKYLYGWLADAPSEDLMWKAFENRDFYQTGGFYHQQETIYPAHAAQKLSLVPPPLQKYFRGFMDEGESITWAEEIDWYSRLAHPDHHLWNQAFATRDIAWHVPRSDDHDSASRTRIPEPMRSVLRETDRQRLVDFINTLEDVERVDDSDPDSGYWRWYVTSHLFISQFYLPEMSPSIGIELEQPALDAVRVVMGRLVSDLYCGDDDIAEMREVVSTAPGISELQRTAFQKMIGVYDRGSKFGCVDWTP